MRRVVALAFLVSLATYAVHLVNDADWVGLALTTAFIFICKKLRT